MKVTVFLFKLLKYLLLIEFFNYLWFVEILGLHKHEYRRMKDKETCGFDLPRYRCIRCTKIVSLEPWQIITLLSLMIYERLPYNRLGNSGWYWDD